MKLKNFLYSIGIACWISIPISGAAIKSWNTPKEEPKLIEYETYVEEHEKAVQNMVRIAEAEKKRYEAQQELITAEEFRQEEIDRHEQLIAEAYETLGKYEVPEDIPYRDYFEQAGEEFNICPEFLEAIAWRESRFKKSAENKGCSGLMQVAVEWHKAKDARPWSE